MENNSQKCPMCGTKLETINGQMTCKTCGYHVYNQNGQANTQNTGFPNVPPTTGTTFQPTPRNNNKWVVPLIIGVVAVVAVIGAVVIFAGFGLLDNARENLLAQNDSSADRQPASTSSAQTGDSTSSTSSRTHVPRSDFFIQLSEAIWGKGYRSITAEEYASLTDLQINQENKAIYYRLSNEDFQSLSYLIDTKMEWSDLCSFTGLEWISIDDKLSKGDLDGLDNLYAVFAENSLSEYAKIIPHPENILQLGAKDSFFTKTLEGIENFPNLQYLSAEYKHLEDISALLDYPDLYGLELYDCDNLMDYSPLMKLTQLETLSLESSNLKTIDFIKQMPNLYSLYIKDSKITSLDALASCPYLDSLYLLDNYSIEDYSIIGELDQLYTLSLSTGSSRTIILPSLEKLTQLDELSLKNVSDLSLLRDAVNVTYLSLEDCVAWELDAITSMQNLITLVIHDFRSLTESLSPLTQLPELMELDLSDTYIYGDISEIFSMPNLYYLNLSDCMVGIDFDNLADNEMLQYLLLDDIKILNGPEYSSGSYDNLSKHYDMFDHFPYLTELYMKNVQLDSIDFVENLPYLRYLDITNNNVTSLKPLESLSDFQAVWCGKNTILENLPDGSNITVITAER